VEDEREGAAVTCGMWLGSGLLYNGYTAAV